MLRSKRILKVNFWDEVAGVLRSLDYEEGLVEFENFYVCIPPNILRKIPLIETMVGKRVAFLRTDVPNKPYIVIEH